MKSNKKHRPAQAEKGAAKTKDDRDKNSLFGNKRPAGSGDRKTIVYPEKMGYHGKDPEKDLNPEE